MLWKHRTKGKLVDSDVWVYLYGRKKTDRNPVETLPSHLPAILTSTLSAGSIAQSNDFPEEKKRGIALKMEEIKDVFVYHQIRSISFPQT